MASKEVIEECAKGAWTTKQARFRFSKEHQTLLDWDEIPDDSKDWMRAEVRMILAIYEYIKRRDGEVS